MKKIVTSLNIYKSHIYMSSLDGSIQMTHINDYRKRLPLIISGGFSSESVILDIKFYKNVPYVLTDSGIYKYTDDNFEVVKELYDASLMCIDSSRGYMFVVSDSRRIICINLKSDRYDLDIRSISSIDLTGKIHSISAMVAKSGVIFLSIINHGVYRINYSVKNSSIHHYVIPKLETKAPQDIFYNKNYQELAIVDYHIGLILLDISSGLIYINKLPRGARPQNIKYIGVNEGVYIIQTNKGLYRFERANRNLEIASEEQVANIITYNKRLYYTVDGKLKSTKI
ncbi:hypothetical protein [Aeromonas hydrophila]|uniref:hypothetical protein n=1 Tax=Aeromonas hydrophila TaxID=644 RepID=UPI0012D41021|nr:hypothetical protein [Aeromonas hydrophila]